jgi:hypothetical protein
VLVDVTVAAAPEGARVAGISFDQLECIDPPVEEPYNAPPLTGAGQR